MKQKSSDHYSSGAVPKKLQPKGTAAENKTRSNNVEKLSYADIFEKVTYDLPSKVKATFKDEKVLVEYLYALCPEWEHFFMRQHAISNLRRSGWNGTLPPGNNLSSEFRSVILVASDLGPLVCPLTGR